MDLISGLVGSLIGAAVVFLAELWRQVLDGKAAARLIYVESHQNALLCDWAADGRTYRSLSDSVWQAHSVHVIPLLTNEASELTVVAYLAVAATEKKVEEVANVQTEAAVVADDLKSHALDFRTAAYWMHFIEQKGRLRLLFELLLARPTLPSASDIQQAIRRLPV